MKYPRTLWLFTLVFLIFNKAAAQIKPPADRKGIYVAVDIGVGSGKVVNNNLYDYGITVSNKIYSCYGLQIGGMFDNHFGVFTGIQLERFGFLYHSRYYSQSSSNNTISEDFISIPFILRIVTSKRRDISFFVNTGFKAMLLSKLTDNYGTGTTNDKTGFQTATFAYTLNFGLEIPAGRNLDFNLGPDIVYQLVNNFDNRKQKGKLRSLGARISIGYRFSK